MTFAPSYIRLYFIQSNRHWNVFFWF